MIKYLLLFLFIAPAANAQQNSTNPNLIKINQIVKKIKADSTLRREWKGDTLSGLPQINIRQKQTVGYFQKDSLVRFHVGHFEGAYLSGFSRDYYFKHGKLIYLAEEISNSSRMGSCGTITVHYEYYLKDDKVIFLRRGHQQGFFETCYGDMGPKDGKKIVELFQTDRMLFK
jgi:hypothetical protein